MATPTLPYLVGQHTVKLYLRRITCAADNKQIASMRDLEAYALGGGNMLPHCPVYWRSRPKRPVSEGITTLAEDRRPEANLFIGLSQNALQRNTHKRIWG